MLKKKKCIMCYFVFHVSSSTPPGKPVVVFFFFMIWKNVGKCCFRALITGSWCPNQCLQTSSGSDAPSAKRCDGASEGVFFRISHQLNDAVRCTLVWSGSICSYFGPKPHHSREPRWCLQDLRTVLFIHSCFYWFCVGCLFFLFFSHMPASTL